MQRAALGVHPDAHAPSRGDAENERCDGRGRRASWPRSERLDELDVPVDVVNVNGHSAIHKCAIYGHGDVIDWLIDRDDALAGGDPTPRLLDAAISPTIELAPRTGHDQRARR